jgi:alpha-1,2-mannosyltransferase
VRLDVRMRGISEKSLYRGAFGLVMLTALFVRSLPLLGSNGAQESADFDEGVYLCAAGLFSEGWTPYEDFALLHPPGILLLLWPLNILAPDILSWSGVLGLARWLGVLIGVTNVALVIAVAARWQGPVSGLVAGSLYASFRPAIYV